ncbi:transcription antitermination factor NusB [Euzebya tangerina]|uniref:transcription antitermination factor NusB n=1 Tax=Euzebya tangerina TaxID=591198 RepID=UPI000E30BE47
MSGTSPPVWVETNDRALPRRDARAAALEVLFAADVRDRSAEALLGDDGSFVDDFTRYLVEVVVHYRAQIDALIEEWADGWTLDRMPVVDRNVLRLGMAEMLHIEEVPAKVAIDEAVELAKSLSTDSSPRFVNGVLAAVARDRSLV